MSGPSATAKPMSAKIAVSSSTTWLIGWMRPASAGASGNGKVTSMVSAASRCSSAAPLSASRRAAIDRGDAILEAVDQRAALLALLRRHLAEGREQRRDRALLAERSDPHGFERRLIAGGLDHARQLAFEGGNVECVVHRCLANGHADMRLPPPRWRRLSRFLSRTGEGQAASAAFALSTIASKAAGSWIARSDSTLRSTTTPALSSPEMNRL